jgi:ATP-dependent Lhr-like helicase
MSPAIQSPDQVDVLERFHPAVASWFREQLGEPTPAQRLGWPAIAVGQNALIVAPTGSGKTLAAFLAALDHLWRTPRVSPGVRILYVSPLKALNSDVSRNLQIPLEGILAKSRCMGTDLPALTVAVRSGDTPAHERARMVRKPPDILITTPESLHLILTSRARETLRAVSHVIVDEIHSVCGNKRGAFLALLLERLEAINPAGFLRIGLSATVKPTDEVARYLGGIKWSGAESIEPRAVTVIDAGWRRDLDLSVIWPAGPNQSLPAGAIWPAIENRLAALVREHRSTIIFTNNRRTVEKLTARLNEVAFADLEVFALDRGALREPKENGSPAGSTTADSIADSGEDPLSEPGDPDLRPFRAHHGSLSPEERRATEEALKRGDVAAVVATASLELGIDMGAVDLVCQVESPGNIARGLQRVGRAGHVVHGVSRGRLIAKTPADLLESAALCRAMIQGRIEHLRVPKGCLDVLAQQVIACVAMERWDVPELFNLVRGAYPFCDLTAEAFEGVLKLISGRFPTAGIRDFRARVAWDPIHNRLAALPGTAHLAVVGGGTIPDTGQFPVYLGDAGPRLGELDEEFVFERRVGETFILGNSSWRIDAIDAHRVVVGKAEGHPGVMPFWRGEASSRSAELGEAVGELSRELIERRDDPELLPRLERECRLEPLAARVLTQFLARQFRLAQAVPDDRTVLIETFPDQTGELGLAVLTPFGGKLHLGLKLALLGRIRERLGVSPACLHGDDGLLFRLPNLDDPPLDLFDGLTGDLAEQLIRAELPETALFGLRFRQNAARALLMPRPDPAKRTPLWLQRLRAKDLLQVARRFPDFPIVIETFRECLDDDLDLPRVRDFFDSIQAGTIRVVGRRGEIPSPMTRELIFAFTTAYMYEWDQPRLGDQRPAAVSVDEDLLEPLLRGGNAPVSDWLDPRAIGRVDSRLRRLGLIPRSVEEMGEQLRQLGDLTEAEVHGPMAAFLGELRATGRAVTIELGGTASPLRWILGEECPLYHAAFLQWGPSSRSSKSDDESADQAAGDARGTIIRRFLQTHALVGLAEITGRYPISAAEATELLERWVEEGTAVRLGEPGEEPQARWAQRDNLAEIRRATVAVRRGETVTVTPEVYADFLLRWQHVHPAARGEGPEFVERVLEQLEARALPPRLWESEVLPRRVANYRTAWLDEVLGRGNWLWRAEHPDLPSGASSKESRGDLTRVAFFLRDSLVQPPSQGEPAELSSDEQHVLGCLERRGASFAAELARALTIEPSRVRRALRDLVGRGLVTNDRFDAVRPGAEAALQVLSEAAAKGRGGHPAPIRPHRLLSGSAEGRWAKVGELIADAEARLLAWGRLLLERYGVVTREIAGLEPAAPAWSELASVLARAEWRGEIRRGYFVEGLSGVQYALEEAGAELLRLAGCPEAASPVLLLSTLDPANLYGAGAPFDVELLEGGVARLPRLPGNYLVVRAGRPVLIVESYGRRLTGLPWASSDEIDRALELLPGLAGPTRRILKIESYNGSPTLESPVASRLVELGFVRDYPGMAYYPGWSATPAGSP